jgi:hypothetical protein
MKLKSVVVYAAVGLAFLFLPRPAHAGPVYPASAGLELDDLWADTLTVSPYDAEDDVGSLQHDPFFGALLRAGAGPRSEAWDVVHPLDYPSHFEEYLPIDTGLSDGGRHGMYIRPQRPNGETDDPANGVAGDPAAAMPEPGTLNLLLAGAVLLVGTRHALKARTKLF